MRYEQLRASGKTIFTVQDVLLLFPTNNPQTVRNFFQRMKKKWIMQCLAWGIWWFTEYNPYELASKLKKNSYISTQTVLKNTGIIFQRQGKTITSISDNTLTKQTDKNTFQYQKISEKIRLNPQWIITHKTYAIATPERALCDAVYLDQHTAIDNLDEINHHMLIALAASYPARVLSRCQQLINDRQSYT